MITARYSTHNWCVSGTYDIGGWAIHCADTEPPEEAARSMGISLDGLEARGGTQVSGAPHSPQAQYWREVCAARQAAVAQIERPGTSFYSMRGDYRRWYDKECVRLADTAEKAVPLPMMADEPTWAWSKDTGFIIR